MEKIKRDTKITKKKRKAMIAECSSVPIRKVGRRRAGRVAPSARLLDLRTPCAQESCAPRVNRRSRKNIRSLFVTSAPRMFLKALTVMLIVGLNSVGLSGIGGTLGYYNDIESSTKNTFQAGSVDFSLAASGWQATSTAVSMPPGDVTKRTVAIDPQDSNPFQYVATSTHFTGDMNFCAGINATAINGSVPMYNGPLTGLLTATTTAFDSWEFAYTIGTNNFQNSVCDFDIDINGWQTRHGFPTYEQGGYSDTEKVKNHLASWGFRINKVYYDVAPERGKEKTNEWVEIYNQTNVPLDISGWKICDNAACDTLPTTPLIPAQKYAVIVATSTTATSTTVSNILPAHWYLPSEVTQINIDSLIGNGLANGADMLQLKRPDGVIVDQMNWGTPSPAWAHYNENLWNPGAVGVAGGHVLARVPSGYDTDTPSDWKELVPPSVDLTYPDEGGSYTWYWTHSYTILWNAVNHNGSDGDLDMSLFYVKDVNHDNKISAGDTTNTIAATTANDGSFNWTVPSGFIGYIWIYLVATGPENPMLNSGTVSGDIYDPIPLFIGPETIITPKLPVEDSVAPVDETPVVEQAPEEVAPTEIVSEKPPVEEVITAPEEVVLPKPDETVTVPEDKVASLVPEETTAAPEEESLPALKEMVPEAAVETPTEPVVPKPSVAPEETPIVTESVVPVVTESAPEPEAIPVPDHVEI